MQGQVRFLVSKSGAVIDSGHLTDITEDQGDQEDTVDTEDQIMEEEGK